MCRPAWRRISAQLLVIGLLGVTVAVFVAVAGRWQGFFDLRVYHGAVSAWVDGDGLYRYSVAGQVRSYGFTYPPFAALIMLPMAGLSWPAVIAVSVTMNVAATLLVLSWLLAPLADRRGWSRWFTVALAAILAAAFEPVRDTVSFGQVNLLLLALVAGDLLLLVSRRHRLAGVGIGLATAVKLTPVIFIGYLVVTRRWRAATVSVATAAGATLVAAAVAPGESREYWTEAIWNVDRVGSLLHVANQSMNGFTARLDAPAGILLWGLLVVAVLALWAWRVRAAVIAHDDVAGLAVTGVAGGLISPVTWVHHLVWLLPAITWLFVRGVDRRRWWPLSLAALAYGLLCSRLVWLFDDQPGGWGLLGSNLYVFLAVLLLVGWPAMSAARGELPAIPAPRPMRNATTSSRFLRTNLANPGAEAERDARHAHGPARNATLPARSTP